MSMRRHARGNWLQALIIIIALGAILGSGKLFLDSIYVPVIIMYHSVGEKETSLDSYGPKLIVRSETFAKQMRFLKDNNYKIIPLALFIEKIKKGERIPPKTIAITFDDGLRNNFLNAYPLLKKYDFPATIFVITDFVGKEKFLTWNDIKTMQRNNISIGSHTLSHRWLPDLERDEIYNELIKSKVVLEENTDQKIETLSYPLGGFNHRVKRIAKASGYIGAVTTNPGKTRPNDDPYALKRIRISMTSDNLFTFWFETSGYYTFIKEHRDSD